jgi:ABC-type transport system substrate-binding protein
VKFDAQTMQVIPDLATDWDISADGRTYTFHLRHGLRFSNGDPLTASDLAYSIDRAFSPGESGAAIRYLSINDVPNIVGAADRAAGKSPTIIGTGVVATSDTTFQINLVQPAACFLAQLTSPVSWVVDKKVVQQYGQTWFDGHAVGTGPFLLKSWQHRVQLTFVPNPHWYGARSYLTEIDMPIISDPRTAFHDFQTKAIDIDPAVDGSDYEVARALGVNEVFEGPVLSVSSLAPNSAVPPFNNLTVRQAFAEAVDRDKIAYWVFHNPVIPSDHLLPRGNPGYYAGLKGLPFNPPDARAKLASVYPDPSLMPRIVLSCFGGVGEDGNLIASILQQDFQTILGVHIDVVPGCPADIDGVPSRSIQLSLSERLMDYPDPQDWLSLQIAGGSFGNTTNFENPQVDHLLAQADVERDQDKRFSLYHQAEELAIDNVALIPFAQGKNLVVFQKDVHGYTLMPNGLPSPDMWADVYMLAA